MNNMDILREMIRNTSTLDDLVSAVIFKTGEKSIPKSNAFLQKTFFELQKKHPDLLKGFIFDESGRVPFSDELDAVLFRLETSTVLPTLNPTYREYSLRNGSNALKESYNDFEENKRTLIDECAADLLSMIQENRAHTME